MKEISILLELLNKVNSILRDGQLISKYQSLLNSINANQIYNDIVADIADFNSKNNIDFPYQFQKKYSLQMGINNYFGHKANERLKLILDKGKNGIQDLQDIINNLSNIRGSFETIYNNFTSLKLIDWEDIDSPYLELIFDGDFEIKSITDLQKNTKDIEKHIKNLSRLTGKIIDEPEIVYMSKNSPVDIVINLGGLEISGGAPGTILAIYGIFDYIVKSILDRIIQVQEIRKKELEIENMKLLNAKIREGFEDQIKEIEENFSERLSDELYTKHKKRLKEGANLGSENEIKKGTKDAIIYFDNLIVKGGTVNIGILPPAEGTEESGNDEYIINDILEKNAKKELLMADVKKLKSGSEQTTEDIIK